MMGIQHACFPSLPLPSQRTCVPPVLMSNRGKHGDREWMEIQLFEDIVNGVGSVAIAVDPDDVPRPSIVLVHRGTRNLVK